MKKHLFHSKEEFDRWLDSQVEDIGNMFHAFGCVEDVERFFGVDFLSVNGKDWDEFELSEEFATATDINEEEWELARPVQYKLRQAYWEGDEPKVPEKYPCLAVSWFEESFDRQGDVCILALAYVYPSDFEQK
jgi:hypothetical protein